MMEKLKRIFQFARQNKLKVTLYAMAYVLHNMVVLWVF